MNNKIFLTLVTMTMAMTACNKKSTKGSGTLGPIYPCDTLNAAGSCDNHVSVDLSDHKFYATVNGSVEGKSGDVVLHLTEDSGSSCSGVAILSSVTLKLNAAGTPVTYAFDTSNFSPESGKTYQLAAVMADGTKACAGISFQ